MDIQLCVALPIVLMRKPGCQGFDRQTAKNHGDVSIHGTLGTLRLNPAKPIIQHILPAILVGGFNPSEKYESQLG